MATGGYETPTESEITETSTAAGASTSTSTEQGNNDKSIFGSIRTGRQYEDFKRYMTNSCPERMVLEYCRVFQTVQWGPCEVFRKPENLKKNRYSNVICLDSNRVILPSGRYIHANWVDGYNTKNAYICTQGPLENTCDEFLETIFEHKVSTVVMLTNVCERVVLKKCYQYVPLHNHEEIDFGNYTVKLEGQRSVQNIYKKSGLLIKKKSTGKFHRFVHYQFLNWNSCGVPSGIEPFLHFYQQIYLSTNASECPVLVHCSDGVGQTGTFVTIDICARRFREQGFIDIRRVLELLRLQRPGCIPVESQYLFCHRTLLDYARIIRQCAAKEQNPDDTSMELERQLRKLKLHNNRLDRESLLTLTHKKGQERMHARFDIRTDRRRKRQNIVQYSTSGTHEGRKRKEERTIKSEINKLRDMRHVNTEWHVRNNRILENIREEPKSD